jgi:hypothetical protein
MNNFGTIKTKILTRLTESYAKKDMTDVKNVLEVIKENKDFKEMYLFYEDIESKYFDNKDTATVYVEEVSKMLKDKAKSISSFCKILSGHLTDITINENKTYKFLDLLSENDTLLNIDKKVTAKKDLINFLTTKKEVKQIQEETLIPNENMLYAVLANNFNVSFDNSLNEEQKNELKNIISLSEEELTTKVSEIKESINNQITGLLNESKDDSLKTKLSKVKDEMSEMSVSKYNYYRLKELKNGLI